MHAYNMHSSPEPASLSMLTHTTTTTTSTTTTSLEHITFTISTNSQPAQFDISVSYGHKGWMRCLNKASHKVASYHNDNFAPRSGLTYGVYAMCPIKTDTNTVLLKLELQ